MKKFLKVTSLILAVLVLALLLLILFWLGPTAKVLVEQIGPKALGTPVTIESLAINPRKGTIDLYGFQIGIHEGFSRTNTWNLAKFHVAVDMRSLFSDTLIIHKIQIDGPHLVYEQNQASDNISEFIRNIQAFAGIDPNEPKPEKPPKGESEKTPKKVLIEQLEINDIQMHLANTHDPELDVQIGIEQLSLSLTSGVVRINHLLLSDPGLLSTPNVIEIEAITIQLDPDSIYSDRIVIEDVQVIRPYAFLENNADTDTVSEFMRLAQSFIDKFAETSPSTPSPSPQGKVEKKPPPVELHNLYVDDIQLKLLDTTRTNAAPEVQTLASIAGISVKLVEGRIQIKEVTVPNPNADFITTNLFHLAQININIDPESLFSDQVIIQNIFVDSPKINLEQTQDRGNMAELQKIIEGFIPPAPQAVVASADSAEPPKPLPLAEQPIVLNSLTVTNLSIHMTLPPETNAPTSSILNRLRPKDWFNDGDAPAPTTPLLTFDHLSVEPLKGLVEIINLQVGNPPGFTHDHLATINLFHLEIDPDSIASDTLLIEEILIDTPKIAYEKKLATDNIKALQASLEAAMAKRADRLEKSEIEPEPAPSSETGPEQKIIIGHLLVQHGIVKAKLSALPTAPIPLPTIERRDMGKKEGGMGMTDTLSNLGTLFYDSILGAVSSVAGFAGDTLKGAGSLTVGALGILPGGATDTPGEQIDLDQQPEKAAAEKPEEKKKSRSTKRRGRPGRHF